MQKGRNIVSADGFEKKIHEVEYELSYLQKKLTEFILNESDRIAMMTIGEFSEYANVSQATITRFVRKIGFASYQEFQRYLKDQLMQKINTVDKMENSIMLADMLSKQQEEWSILQGEYLNMHSFEKEINLELYREVAEKICVAKRVYLVGMSSSKALVEFLTYRFRWMGIQVEACTVGGNDFLEQLAGLSTEDLLFCIGFRKTYQEVSIALKYAQKEGIEIVGIAESKTNEIHDYTKLVIPVKRGPEEKWNSLALPMAICNILVRMCLELRGEEALKFARKYQWLLNEFSGGKR